MATAERVATERIPPQESALWNSGPRVRKRLHPRWRKGHWGNSCTRGPECCPNLRGLNRRKIW